MFKGTDTPEMDWLKVIHAVNEIRPGTFGEPDGLGEVTKNGVPGRYIEDYPEALVVFESMVTRDAVQGSPVLVIGKTREVEAAIELAVRKIGV